MSLLPSDEPKGLQTWVGRLFKSASGGTTPARDPEEIIPPEKRKAAMTTLDPLEFKLAFWALVLATVAGIAIPLFKYFEHTTARTERTPSPSAPTPCSSWA